MKEPDAIAKDVRNFSSTLDDRMTDETKTIAIRDPNADVELIVESEPAELLRLEIRDCAPPRLHYPGPMRLDFDEVAQLRDLLDDWLNEAPI